MKARYTLLIIVAGTILAIQLVGCRSQPISESTGPDPFFVEIWASDGCPKVGETVILRATVKNVGTETQIVDLQDQPVLDIVAGAQSAGQRWSAGKSLTPELTQLELKPGESKSIVMPWNPQQGQVPIVSARFIESLQMADYPSMPSLTLGGAECYFYGW